MKNIHLNTNNILQALQISVTPRFRKERGRGRVCNYLKPGESKQTNKQTNKQTMSHQPTPIQRARQLRQQMTLEEKILWKKLRARRFMGLKFNRQHPIIYQVTNNKPYYFIADFYCAEKKLVIEVDGKIHDFQKEYDQSRDEILNALGLAVLRIKNEELENLKNVLGKINRACES